VIPIQGAGAYDENNYWSKIGLLDGDGENRGSIPLERRKY
jgi:hypothetical protein